MTAFAHQDCIKSIGNGGVHKDSFVLKTLCVLNTGAIAMPVCGKFKRYSIESYFAFVL